MELDAGHYGLHGLTLSMVGRRYFAGDTANALPKLPGHGVVDWRSDWKAGPWQFTLRALNLLDKKYSTFAGFQSDPANDFFYYPAEPRTVTGTVSYAWK
jgi:outer membrane receptor protein involved in Fe transport